jgi:ankyrin repeat protein
MLFFSLSPDTLRAHQMTLSILTQYRDYMAVAEARALVAERQLNEAREAVEYLRARSTQTEDLAKSVVLFVRGQGPEEQQACLSAAIKSARERNPLPPKPATSLILEMTPEERRAAAEKEAAAMAESDVLLATPKYASLTDRLREFEHFLELKKKKTLQRQPSSDDMNLAAAVDETTPATRAASLSVSAGSGSGINRNNSGNLSLGLGLKASQITGDVAPLVSPSVVSRKFGGGGSFQALVRERKTPHDFPFYDLPSVLHVQRLVNVLSARNAGSRGKAPTQQDDAVREEANRPTPNLEWICTELVTSKKRSRIDPLWRSDAGRSLLHIVCEHEGSGRAVKVLLAEKHDCAALDDTGLSAFHVACISGALDAVQAMYKHGPGRSLLDLKVLGHLTPLHAAALFNRVAVLKLLLEKGANGAPVDALGCSPLVYAVLNDKFSAAKFLAEKVHGLVNTAAQDGNSPLLFACCVAGVNDVTALLSAGANPNMANQVGISPLWIAMQNDDADLAMAVLDFKPTDASQKLNLDQPLGPFGNTIMMQAIAFLSSGVKAASFVGMLLSKGASVHATNRDKKTALFFAAAFDRVDAMRLLLERGADPNAKDANQNRPLHFAQSVDAVSLLFTSGAKVNVKNKQGNTPLHVAFGLQNRMTANILISSGGNENSCNAAGQTCLDLAQFLQTKIAMPFFAGDVDYAETGGIMLK